MLIVPELELVIVLVPRTGSGSLRRAILQKFRRAFMPYRHMEADGVLPGYDRWRRIGFVREPVARLWSLYKFLRDFDGPHDRAYIRAQRACVNMPFDDWITDNETVFTSPYDSAGRGRFFPEFNVRHALPENRKSQFVYLRPDLGTEIQRYEHMTLFAEGLGLTVDRHNSTAAEPPPVLSARAVDHVARFFEWDLRAVADRVAA